MNALDLFRLAFGRLGTGRLRTALTMLGVVIGVASVVALVAVGQGATSGISSRLQGLGTNLLTVNAGASFSGVTRGAAGSSTTLKLADADALRSLAGVEAVAPELSTQKLVVAGSKNTTTTVVGTTADYPTVRAYTIWQGSFLTTASVDARLRVAVLGATTADDLGLGASAIGTDVTIGGLPFRVVGILQAKGGTGFQSPDDEVLIPVSTASALIVGGTSVRSVGVSVATPDQMTTVTAEITAALRERHGLTGTAADDFTIQNQDQLLATVSSVSTLLTVLLAGIASISLIVGGIGIMNIMLVSVRERTREIGIRKAIGARGRDIMAQFLIEALVLSLAGGLFGIAIGLAISALIGVVAGWGFIFSPLTILAAVGFSLMVGIVFGVWPASQAARLDPVVALRYE
ncbi:MAG TPA: ABC transporter permease [Candidatus Limnocylindrales bacterium]